MEEGFPDDRATKKHLDLTERLRPGTHQRERESGIDRCHSALDFLAISLDDIFPRKVAVSVKVRSIQYGG